MSPSYRTLSRLHSRLNFWLQPASHSIKESGSSLPRLVRSFARSLVHPLSAARTCQKLLTYFGLRPLLLALSHASHGENVILLIFASLRLSRLLQKQHSSVLLDITLHCFFDHLYTSDVHFWLIIHSKYEYSALSLLIACIRTEGRSSSEKPRNHSILGAYLST